MATGQTGPSARPFRMASEGRWGDRDALAILRRGDRITPLDLVAVLSRQPHVDVLTGLMAGPARDVQHEAPDLHAQDDSSRRVRRFAHVESRPVVTLHVILTVAATAASLVVIAAAISSVLAGRRSGGHRDYRSAVDRAVLAVLGSTLAAALIGTVLLVTGSRPADPLHYVYGPAALIALPVAIWVGARATPAGSSRVRRDVWTAGGGLVLLGIVLRLFATG